MGIGVCIMMTSIASRLTILSDRTGIAHIVFDQGLAYRNALMFISLDSVSFSLALYPTPRVYELYLILRNSS
jgi:hypothetical protein